MVYEKKQIYSLFSVSIHSNVQVTRSVLQVACMYSTLYTCIVLSWLYSSTNSDSAIGNGIFVMTVHAHPHTHNWLGLFLISTWVTFLEQCPHCFGTIVYFFSPTKKISWVRLFTDVSESEWVREWECDLWGRLPTRKSRVGITLYWGFQSGRDHNP